MSSPSHVRALRLPVDKHIQPNGLLDVDGVGNVGVDALLVLGNIDLALPEFLPSVADVCMGVQG